MTGGDGREGRERKGDGSEERRESRARGKPRVKYKCSGEESRVVVDASSFITAALAAKKLCQVSIDHRSPQAKRTQRSPC